MAAFLSRWVRSASAGIPAGLRRAVKRRLDARAVGAREAAARAGLVREAVRLSAVCEQLPAVDPSYVPDDSILQEFL